jgi:uncharacterized protein (DUF2252 family)
VGLIRDLMRRYPQTLDQPERFKPEMFSIKGISKRFGAGVSSYPALRFYVLIEGETDSIHDDILLELKECFDPVGIPLRNVFNGQRFQHNADRIVWAQRAFQRVPDADVWLGWAAQGSGVVGMRVRHRTKYQRGVSLDRIQERLERGTWVHEDLRVFAQRAGALLAMSHLRAPTSDGRRGRDVIVEALGRGEQARFVEEVREVGRRYGAQTMEDYERLRAMIVLYGDDLGYRSQRGPRP